MNPQGKLNAGQQTAMLDYKPLRIWNALLHHKSREGLSLGSLQKLF